jgi:hypothetical protein
MEAMQILQLAIPVAGVAAEPMVRRFLIRCVVICLRVTVRLESLTCRSATPYEEQESLFIQHSDVDRPGLLVKRWMVLACPWT